MLYNRGTGTSNAKSCVFRSSDLRQHQQEQLCLWLQRTLLSLHQTPRACHLLAQLPFEQSVLSRASAAPVNSTVRRAFLSRAAAAAAAARSCIASRARREARGGDERRQRMNGSGASISGPRRGPSALASCTPSPNARHRSARRAPLRPLPSLLRGSAPHERPSPGLPGQPGMSGGG